MSNNTFSIGRFFNFSKCSNGPGTCYYVEGFQGCGFFLNAACLAQKLEEKYPGQVRVFVTMRSRESWPGALEERKKEVAGAEQHRTSPIVYEGCPSGKKNVPPCLKLVGGFTEFFREAIEKFGTVDLSDCSKFRPQQNV
eukprot:jgi/Galph1/2737/GphlegSOOS_G1427.1